MFIKHSTPEIKENVITFSSSDVVDRNLAHKKLKNTICQAEDGIFELTK